MAQYDVYVNPSLRSRESVPFIVDVQSAPLGALGLRLTMPLSRVGIDARGGMPRRLVPQFVIEGKRLALLPHAAAGIDARLLRDVVGSLADHAGEIRDALDAVLSGV
jgi:toxin CcdB